MGILDSVQYDLAATQADIGRKRRFTCPPGTIMDGYSYACNLGDFGCFPTNDSCCNLNESLPSCPVKILDPPTEPRPAQVDISVCMAAPTACMLFRSICRENPATELCALAMYELCPEFVSL